MVKRREENAIQDRRVDDDFGLWLEGSWECRIYIEREYEKKGSSTGIRFSLVHDAPMPVCIYPVRRPSLSC